MSVIKANKHQIGSNATLSKNIVLESNVDGDLVISKGVHDGTLTEIARITNAGNLKLGGTWNTAHFELGIYHIWVDSTGDLRIKSSAPISDTDGSVIGTQT